MSWSGFHFLLLYFWIHFVDNGGLRKKFCLCLFRSSNFLILYHILQWRGVVTLLLDVSMSSLSSEVSHAACCSAGLIPPVVYCLVSVSCLRQEGDVTGNVTSVQTRHFLTYWQRSVQSSNSAAKTGGNLLCKCFKSHLSNWLSKTYWTLVSTVTCFEWCSVSSVSFIPQTWPWIFLDLWGLALGLHLWLRFWSLHQAWEECLAICISRCVWMLDQDQHTVIDTHTHPHIHLLVWWTSGTLKTSTQLRHTGKSRLINGVLMWAGSWFPWRSDK